MEESPGNSYWYRDAIICVPSDGVFLFLHPLPDTLVPSPLDPQSLNRFSYGLNNPVKYVDPSGHEAELGTEADCQSWDTWCWENRYWTAQGKCYSERSGEWTRECIPEFQDADILGENLYGTEFWGDFSEAEKNAVSGILARFADFVGGANRLRDLFYSAVTWRSIYTTLAICKDCDSGALWRPERGYINLPDWVFSARAGQDRVVGWGNPYASASLIGHEIAHVLLDGVRHSTGINLEDWYINRARPGSEPSSMMGLSPNEELATVLSVSVTVPASYREINYTPSMQEFAANFARFVLMYGIVPYEGPH